MAAYWTVANFNKHWKGTLQANDVLALSSINMADDTQTRTAQQQQPPESSTTWVSRFKTRVAVEDESRQLLCKALNVHDGDGERYQSPRNGTLEGFWVGRRTDISNTAASNRIMSETDKYTSMLLDSTSRTVVLYVHGSPFRENFKSISKLVAQTGGRGFCVRQRMTPQHSFPEALLDVFHAYLTLLAPPPGAPHAPVPASSIVLAGDSSSTGLALSLLQLLLIIKRERESLDQTIRFYGRDVKLALPAGLAVMSVGPGPSESIIADQYSFSDVTPSFRSVESSGGVEASGVVGRATYGAVPMLHHHVMTEDECELSPACLADAQDQLVDIIKSLRQEAGAPALDDVVPGFDTTSRAMALSSPQADDIYRSWADNIRQMQPGGELYMRAVYVRAGGSREQQSPSDCLSPLTMEEARDSLAKAIQQVHLDTGRRRAPESKL